MKDYDPMRDYDPIETAFLLLGCLVVTLCLRAAQWVAREDLVRE